MAKMNNYVYTVEETDGELMITRNGKRFWGMWKPNLASTIIINERISVSEWIRHLHEKTWVSPELLYQYASHIQRLNPHNDIDWYSTFMFVERSDYLNKAFEIKKQLEETKKGFAEEFMERVKFGHEAFTKDEMQIIHKILTERLRQYKLPFTHKDEE